MTHHCTTCNRQVLHDGTTCCVCAGRGEMPKADRVTKMAAYFVDGGCSSFSCWKRKDGTTSIEQWGEQGWSKAAEATKEVERLREIIDEARSIAFCEYPKATDGFAPWKDCGDCVGCKVRAALTPKETIDD